MGTVVPHADELYLRSVIWANTAAESLFGAAPGVERAPRSAAPSEPAPAPAPVAATSRNGGGPVRRFFAAVGRLFGRRA